MNKKVCILTVFIVGLLAISAVSAADNSTGIEKTTENAINLGQAADIQDSQILLKEDSGDAGTFEELYNLIENTTEGTVLELDNDYRYVNGSNEGIQISKTITIDGKGHALDGNCLSRIFNVCAGNVTLKNLTFVNALFKNSGGAVYWSGGDGAIFDCSFVNCSASFTGGAIYWSENVANISGCSFVNCSANVGRAIYLNKCNAGTISDCRFLNFNGCRTIECYRCNNNTISNCSFLNCNGGGAISLNGDDGAVFGCSFVNCNGGGAVSWNGKNGVVSNCSFVNCSANYTSGMFKNGGGAVNWDGDGGTVSGCSFVNCSSCYGGAIKGGKVSGCSFVNCSSYSGGAVNAYSIFDCSFVNCSADFGGAISQDGHDSIVSSCSFVNCSAKSGGAIMWNVDYGVILNCSFVNCSADRGGAIRWNVKYSAVMKYRKGTVFDCSFVNCSAKGNGGAIEWKDKNGTVCGCRFIGCSAACGGAVYDGNAFDCTFHGNRANEGNNWYNTEVPKLNISVSDFNSTYRSGDALFLNATDVNGLVIANVIVTINVYENGVLVGAYCALTNRYWIVDLAEGNYTADMTVENNAFELAETVIIRLTISEMLANVSDTNETKEIPSKEDFITVAFVSDEGVVTLTVNGTDYLFAVFNALGNVVAPDLNESCIIYGGKDSYHESVGHVDFKKVIPKLTAKAKTFKKSAKIKKYSITLKTNKNKAMKKVKVTIKVNKKKYTAKTNNKSVATFNLKLTKKGKYSAVITYGGNEYCSGVTKKVKITVK